MKEIRKQDHAKEVEWHIKRNEKGASGWAIDLAKKLVK